MGSGKTFHALPKNVILLPKALCLPALQGHSHVSPDAQWASVRVSLSEVLLVFPESVASAASGGSIAVFLSQQSHVFFRLWGSPTAKIQPHEGEILFYPVDNPGKVVLFYQFPQGLVLTVTFGIYFNPLNDTARGVPWLNGCIPSTTDSYVKS